MGNMQLIFGGDVNDPIKSYLLISCKKGTEETEN